MIPILYSNDILHRVQAGTGAESCRMDEFDKVVSCEVTETINKEYTMKMEITFNDQNAGVVLPAMYVKCKPNPEDPDQYFRIVNTSRDSSTGIIRLDCKHIVYNFMSMYSVGGLGNVNSINYYTARKPKAIMDEIFDDYFIYKTGYNSLFAFHATDSLFTANKMYVGAQHPEYMEKIMWQNKGSLEDVFAGQYKFDNFDIYFYPQRGTDKPIEVSYGQNLNKSVKNLSMNEIYTRIQPYCKAKRYQTPARDTIQTFWYYAAQPYSFQDCDIDIVGENRAYLLDCSDYIDDIILDYDQTTSSEIDNIMQARCEAFAKLNKLNRLTTEFDITVQAELDSMKNIFVGDTIRVVLDKNNTVVKSQIVGGRYDAINERWNSLTVGKKALTFADYILGDKI